MDRATSAGASVEHMGATAASFLRGRPNLTQGRRDAEAQKGKEREAFHSCNGFEQPQPSECHPFAIRSLPFFASLRPRVFALESELQGYFGTAAGFCVS